MKMPKTKLGWCDRCDENSTRVRIAEDKKRILYCINGGHGFIQFLSPLPAKKEERANEQDNEVFRRSAKKVSQYTR